MNEVRGCDRFGKILFDSTGWIDGVNLDFVVFRNVGCGRGIADVLCR